MKCEKAIFLGDAHFPEVNERVFNTAMQIIKSVKPDNIFILGDWMEFGQVSKYRKSPEIMLKLQSDINAGIEGLKQIRRVAPKSNITYLEGNHEKRLEKYLIDNPGLFSLDCLTVPSLLQLNSLNIHYSKNPIKYNNLIIYHGTYARQDAGASAKAEWKKWIASGLSGHSHRIGAYTVRGLGGDIGWWECGALCQRDNLTYDIFPNFQNGLCVGFFYGKHFQIEMVYICSDDGIAIWGGKVFCGK